MPVLSFLWVEPCSKRTKSLFTLSLFFIGFHRLTFSKALRILNILVFFTSYYSYYHYYYYYYFVKFLGMVEGGGNREGRGVYRKGGWHVVKYRELGGEAWNMQRTALHASLTAHQTFIAWNHKRAVGADDSWWSERWADERGEKKRGDRGWNGEMPRRGVGRRGMEGRMW